MTISEMVENTGNVGNVVNVGNSVNIIYPFYLWNTGLETVTFWVKIMKKRLTFWEKSNQDF